MPTLARRSTGCSRGPAPLHRTSERVFAKLAFGERAEGIVAVVRIPSLELERLSLPVDPLVLVLEGVEKPGNLGAVLRTADGAGVDAVVAASPRTDLFNPNTIRASAGTVFAVPTASALDRRRAGLAARRAVSGSWRRGSTPSGCTPTPT